VFETGNFWGSESGRVCSRDHCFNGAGHRRPDALPGSAAHFQRQFNANSTPDAVS